MQVTVAIDESRFEKIVRQLINEQKKLMKQIEIPASFEKVVAWREHRSEFWMDFSRKRVDARIEIAM